MYQTALDKWGRQSECGRDLSDYGKALKDGNVVFIKAFIKKYYALLVYRDVYYTQKDKIATLNLLEVEIKRYEVSDADLEV